jgi:cob(I)alamin adenosyltransferase
MAKEIKIYTRGGDEGFTSLASGVRIAKSAPQLDAYGSVDELNSVVGIIRAHLDDSLDKTRNLDRQLKTIQNLLFNVGSLLACDSDALRMKMPQLPIAAATDLENQIDGLSAPLTELKNFILPGGSPVSSYCHLARTVCRRAEREVVRYLEKDKVSLPHIVVYLNRLSDYLFVLARYLNHQAQIEDSMWEK